MKKLFTALCVLLVALQQSNAQDVQIEGKTFQTVKKTVLNAEAEFCQLKEKGKTGAQNESYIKTGGKFHKTVFTETELKSFLTTWKLSALGKVENKKFPNGAKINFIDKGDVFIIAWIQNTSLKFLEISDYQILKKLKPSIKAKRMGGGGLSANEEAREKCMNDCGDIVVGDVTDPSDIGCIDDGDGACEKWFNDCLDACTNKYPARIKGEGLNAYSLLLKNLGVKIKI